MAAVDGRVNSAVEDDKIVKGKLPMLFVIDFEVSLVPSSTVR